MTLQKSKYFHITSPLARLLWNFKTTLHSIAGVLNTHYMTSHLTQVLFFKSSICWIKSITRYSHILRSHFNVSDLRTIYDFQFPILRFNFRYENSNMNMDSTAEIYNEALIMIEDLCLEIVNKVLNQLGLSSPNKSAATSFEVELRHTHNCNTDYLLSCVQSNISKVTLEQKGIYGQIMQVT